MSAEAGAIDVHHHVLSPRYVAARARLGVATGPGFEGALGWTPAASLEAMDKAGIATAILSNPSNWTPFAADEARDLARDNNAFAAELCREHPGRFGFFGAIPMPDVEASLREIARALDELGADGISTTTNYGDRWASDPAFEPVFAELNRRRAVVFVHPQAAARTTGLVPPVPDSTIEFMFDVTRCITSMLYRGTFTRFPDIRFIFTHGGGGIPALAERIDRNTRNQPAVAALLPGGALPVLQRLWFDLTTTTSAPAVAAIRELLLPGQLLFGSDYPFMPAAATAAGLAQRFAPEEAAQIRRGNALALFPRFGGAG